MVGLLYPDEGDVLVHGESIPGTWPMMISSRRARSSACCSRTGPCSGRMNLLDNVAFPLRQHTDKSEEEILENVRLPP